MADNTKISELDQIQSLSNNDEFMVVDKSVTSGKDASSSGKTTRVTLNQLKEAVSASGTKGDKGDQGPQGVQGAQGARGPAGNDGARGPAGETGQKGETGANGARGATGAPGVQGPKGDRGATGPEGPRGETGQTGARGANGQQGSKGSKGSIGSPGNSNAHLLFGHTNGTVDPTGQKIRKTSGGGNNWNTQIISNVSYANGCYVSFRPSGYPTMMLGLNSKSDLGSLSYTGLDFCWYVHENKVLAVYESGKGYTIGSYSPSDVLTITYDNYTIRYLQNGQVKRSVTVGAGKTYHLDSSLHMHGKTDWATSMIAFGPMGAVGTRGATGAPGTPGAKGQKGATGVGQKGAAGSTASITTSTTITPGQIKLGGKTDSRIDDEGSWGFRSRTNSGYIQFGPANAGHAHIYTDRANFYFNKELLVNGKTVYHSGNLSAARKNFPGARSASHYTVDNWLEFKTNAGLFWGSGTGKEWHIYPQATANMYFRSGSNSTGSFKFTCANTTVQAHLYWNSAQELGFLSNGGGWRLRSRLNNAYGPNLWFHNQSAWSGNPGNNVGKIEYHSNRFYIVSGANSTYLTVFRRDNSDKASILYDGVYQSPGINLGTGISVRALSHQMKVSNKYGYFDIGTRNTSHCHFDTDRHSFYFYKGAYIKNFVHSYGNITVGPSTSHLQTTHIGKAGHITIGSTPGSATEGGQLNLKVPEKNNIDGTGGYMAVDCYADHTNHFKNYHSDSRSIMGRIYYQPHGGGGYNLLSISSDYVHHLHGHLSLYDGNDACVIHCGNPVGNKKYPNFTLRASSKHKSWYNFFQVNYQNGNVSTIGNYYGRQNLSDVRKKKDIERLDSTDSLNTLMQLKPVKFNWKDEDKNKENGDKTLGLIAQEIEEVLPGVVVNVDDIDNQKAGNIDGSPMKSNKTQESVKTKVVEYTELVPLLISAVQRLTQEVETLKQRK